MCTRTAGGSHSALMKFVQVTDLHIVPRGRTLHGLDSISRLEQCVADINRFSSGLSFCVFTGDLADRGDRESYLLLHELLGSLNVPYHMILGNHDRRQAFFEVFSGYPRDDNGFVQFEIDTPSGRMLFLDTLDEGRSQGIYCADRQGWLRARLREAVDKPVYLFMHHPPFDINIPSLDAIKLDDEEGFATMISTSNVRHLFFGHVHRSVSGCWRGVPFSALPSTNHQIATDFEITAPMPYNHAPPAYAFVYLEDEITVVDQHQYLHQHPRRLADGNWTD